MEKQSSRGGRQPNVVISFKCYEIATLLRSLAMTMLFGLLTFEL